MARPLQLRMTEAVRGLRNLDTAGLSVGQRAVRRCMLDRFASDSVDEVSKVRAGTWPAELVKAFQRYWRTELLGGLSSSSDEAEQALLQDILETVPGASQVGATSLDDIEPYVVRQLASEGFHAQMGVTLPLRELLLWAQQDSRREQVALPSGMEPVTVELMSDFRSRGWAHYATCGRSSAGGWIGRDRLFAVADAYDFDTEGYRVSYLAHEAQHFYDRRTFEELPSWHLEYRAKLVELILADETREQLLQTFAADRSSDEAVPHSYANDVLLRRLGEALEVDVRDDADRLLDVPPDRLASAAKWLLRLDTEGLRSGAEGL